MQYLVCVSREGFGDFSAEDLTLGRRYEVISPVDSKGLIRVKDDSGEAFLYLASLFSPAEDAPGE